MPSSVYLETFDDGPGGWYGWGGNHVGLKPLPWQKGQITSQSPWWVDYNHAPPGAGYLHMLGSLNTRGPFSDHHKDVAGKNAFADQRLPLDFSNARITVRTRGELETRGAQVVLLIQGRVDDLVSGWLLTGDPIQIGPEWREQTIVASADQTKWTALGARHDRQDYYGYRPFEKVLRHVDTNIIFVLFPLDVRPMGPINGDQHTLRAGRDYPLWTSRLPEGYIHFDTVKIEFAG